MTKKELAIANHDKKYNCCQAVACSFCKEIGVDEETLFKAGEAFGLGMGGMEGTCGAVSGAVMLAGFKMCIRDSKCIFISIGKNGMNMRACLPSRLLCQQVNLSLIHI